MELRPVTGGFIRPFGTTWFIIEYLKGNAPEGSVKIEPYEGAPMTDIHDSYKGALHRAHARDRAEKDEERRMRKGGLAYSEKEYQERLNYYLERIPQKLLSMRYASFTRYFGHLKRLGWVEATGETESSTFQDDYPLAPPRVYYRLTQAGWKATLAEMADPLITLYNYSRERRSAKKKAYIRR